MRIQDFDLPELEDMLREAMEDTDNASMTVLGGDLSEAQGCIVIVKGGIQTRGLLNFLQEYGYITPGKPIVGIAKP